MVQEASRRPVMVFDFWKEADQLVTWRFAFSAWQTLLHIRRKGQRIKIRWMCFRGRQIIAAWSALISQDYLRLRRKVFTRYNNRWPVIMGKLLLMIIRLWANRPQPMYLLQM